MCRLPEENRGGLGQSSPNIPLKAKVCRPLPLQLAWVGVYKGLAVEERLSGAGCLSINSDAARKERGGWRFEKAELWGQAGGCSVTARQ